MLYINPAVIPAFFNYLFFIWNNEQNADEDTVWLYVSYLKNKLRSIVTAVTINGDKGGAFTLTE